MRETRRRFVWMLAAVGGVAVTRGAVFAQLPHTNFPHPPPPADPMQQDQKAPPETLDPQAAKKVQLQQNEKAFRQDVEKLYQLAGELKKEVEKTPTASVFSVQMYRRTEEIEKLAKQLKSRSKG